MVKFMLDLIERNPLCVAFLNRMDFQLDLSFLLKALKTNCRVLFCLKGAREMITTRLEIDARTDALPLLQSVVAAATNTDENNSMSHDKVE